LPQGKGKLGKNESHVARERERTQERGRRNSEREYGATRVRGHDYAITNKCKSILPFPLIMKNGGGALQRLILQPHLIQRLAHRLPGTRRRPRSAVHLFGGTGERERNVIRRAGTGTRTLATRQRQVGQECERERENAREPERERETEGGSEAKASWASMSFNTSTQHCRTCLRIRVGLRQLYSRHGVHTDN